MPPKGLPSLRPEQVEKRRLRAVHRPRSRVYPVHRAQFLGEHDLDDVVHEPVVGRGYLARGLPGPRGRVRNGVQRNAPSASGTWASSSRRAVNESRRAGDSFVRGPRNHLALIAAVSRRQHESRSHLLIRDRWSRLRLPRGSNPMPDGSLGDARGNALRQRQRDAAVAVRLV